MSLQVDKKFINLLSPRLPKFEWKGDGTAVFRCPLCGDSKKNKNKKRGYLYPFKDKYMMKCHNCSASLSFKNFLKQMDYNLHKEYIYDNFKYNNDHKWFENRQETQNKDTSHLIKSDSNDPLYCLKAITELQSGHKAYDYVMTRKIPKEFWPLIFYCDNYKQWINDNVEPGKFDGKAEPDERLVIPFLNGAGVPYAYQGRYIGNNPDEQRYISINPVKENPLIYGLERLESNKPIYVVEGPIDSMFLPNCVAAGGSSMNKLLTMKNLNLIFIMDNEPRNKEICKILLNIIKKDCKVVIWPDNIPHKDINDMILNGISKEEILDIIEKNTYNGPKAVLRFNTWKKV